MRELQNLRVDIFIYSFSGREWTLGVDGINFFHQTGLGPESWRAAAKDAVMKEVFFLTKHHDDLCFCDKGYPTRSASSSSSRGRLILWLGDA